MIGLLGAEQENWLRVVEPPVGGSFSWGSGIDHGAMIRYNIIRHLSMLVLCLEVFFFTSQPGIFICWL